MMKMGTLLLVLLLLMFHAACGEPIDQRVAKLLVSSCAATTSHHSNARDRCAYALTADEHLRAAIAEPIRWGARLQGTSLERALDDSNTTTFNPRVWRRLYLSTFMFDRVGTVQQAGDYRVLEMPVSFRNTMDAGEYPYPFWHSMKK